MSNVENEGQHKIQLLEQLQAELDNKVEKHISQQSAQSDANMY